MNECPCGSGNAYESCCEPYITGKEPAPTAEALMRSRYSAFAVKNVDYLGDTLAPESKHDYDENQVKNWAETSTWLGLEIVSTSKGLVDDETGEVEFIAKFRQQGAIHTHHEASRFEKRDGHWLYLEGDIVPPMPIKKDKKVGRNEPCPCGSGKKYKKCCG
ncbi:YchJ family protein [Desulfovibrio sp. JC022]|uniref:YchJ family protein n=1 Tax=Desulfovibrio sp. JC022 TaxID=2593642 RepID=UPI0013D662BA|nr:YchJ family protein [Desulfovibrio sp. JC022]NDV24027.1 YchJ family protein [Desulfovibrio sp. JC022]